MSDKKDLHWQKRQGRIKDENITNKENEVEIMEKTMDKIIAVAKSSIILSARNLSLHSLQSINGSEKLPR